jgi:hypothetical protein
LVDWTTKFAAEYSSNPRCVKDGRFGLALRPLTARE